MYYPHGENFIPCPPRFPDFWRKFRVPFIFARPTSHPPTPPPLLLLPGNEEREILIEMENEKREVEIEHRILYEYPRGNLCNF